MLTFKRSGLRFVMLAYVTTPLFLLFHTSSFAQGTFRGKVTDENGEAMIGATLLLKNNPAVGTVTDLDGNFNLMIKDSGQQVVLITMMGYTSLEETLLLKKGEVAVKNFQMAPLVVEKQEVVVTAKAVKANDQYMENMKLRSATTLDYISSETIRKTGDANVVAAVARIPGVSTNGQFITVRGIGDRYVKTAVNGSRIPTLDPFTNNIKLDLLPTSLVDNILITKTASPDLSGDWAGAYISVETKDYPEQLAVNIESAAAWNRNATFKQVLSSQRSKTDWLGYDNGYRNYNHSLYRTPVPAPNLYQQMVGLGLGDFYRSLGVTENWLPGTTLGDVLFKLGLVELGLLPKALFNDASAFAQAKLQFQNGEYANTAFVNLNTESARGSAAMSNNWNLIQRMAIPNLSQNISIGNQFSLAGRPLGFVAALRYSSAVQYDPRSAANRIDASVDSSGLPIIVPTSLIQQQVARETFGWSALINLACKYHPNHSLSFIFMPNYLGVNNLRKGTDTASNEFIRYSNTQFYESRRQLVYQLKSEHFFPNPKLKIELNAAYTQGQSDAPDFKDLRYSLDRNTLQYQIGGGGGSEIQRYYRYLKEDLADVRLSVELPISKQAGRVRKLKFGGAYNYNGRVYDQYVYDLFLHPDHQTFLTPNLDSFFAAENFQISYGEYLGQPYAKMNAWYIENSDPANHNFGYSHIGAAFAMLDYDITPSFRLAGGLRVEYANIFTDVTKYYQKGYAYNDGRRISRSVLANPGELKELNYLPSFNAIYRAFNNENTQVNLRASYSYSLARPSMRELSETLVYDYELQALVFGNSQLKSVRIHNADLRAEANFNRKHYISLSGFYKYFFNHIELVNLSYYSWQNVDKSQVYGVEFEGRATPVKGLELKANTSYIYSRSTVVNYTVGSSLNERVPVDTIQRTMFGQAPYVVNAIASYTFEKIGFAVSLSYNVQGPKLVIAGITTGGRPDVYERPRHLLDAKVSQRIGRYFSISITGKNLLNAPVQRTFRFQNQWLHDYDKFTWGQDVQLSIAFKL